MEISLLGPVGCTAAGSPVALGRPQERCLLAILAVELGRVVPLDRLVELLWDGHTPDRARSIVHTHVSRLRATLRAADAERAGVRLLTKGQGYLLEAPPESVDVHRFLRMVSQANQAGDPAMVSRTLHAALSLWHGPALADVATPRVREQICAGLDELRLTATEDRIEADLALGRHREVVTELAALAALRPVRERSVGLLMVALYRSGQQAQALERYRAARARLIEELGIEPGPQLRRLEQAILTHDPSLSPVEVRAHRGDGPAWRGPRSHLTSIVGRERQLAEVTRLLTDHRLVTVVGSGGVGKTTLAMHVAESIVDGPPVIVAALASARNEDDVILTLASVLGVVGTTMAEVWEAVEKGIAERPHLLVLDNCEHLVAECARLVRRLLTSSATLVVLATSRQPLNLPEETVWRLEPLDLTPAVTLFLRRAAIDYAGEDERAAISRICERVEGVPLALELAAGRLRNLTVEELAAQLDRGFGHTLTATIDWSYRLLSAHERRLLARLAVFCGGFNEEAAAAVCDVSPSALSSLVDRSLVQAYPSDAGQRFRLLEVVREFAAERLAESGERAAIAGRHLDFWLTRAREIHDKPQVDEQFAAWAKLAGDLDNLRAAADDGYANGRVQEAVELALLMMDCLAATNAYAEQERWIDQMSPYLPQCPPSLRSLAQMSRSNLQMMRDDPAGALVLGKPVYHDLAAEHGLMYLDAQVCTVRNALHLLDPNAFGEAAALHGKLRNVDDRHIRLHSLVMAAEALSQSGHHAQARQLCERDCPPRDELDHGGELRYGSILLLTQLGCGELDDAGVTAARLRGRIGQPGYLSVNTPAHSLALHALGAEPPVVAARTIAGLVDMLDAKYPPTLSRAYALSLLLAEAHRRAGDLNAALSCLRHGLRLARSRTTYAWTTPAAITAALIASEFGEGRDLAEHWDRVRQPLGLPAPFGYEEQVAQLGLDPRSRPATAAWAQQPLQEMLSLVERVTLRLCVD